MDLDIIYQDNHILSVFKPQNISMEDLTLTVSNFIKTSKNKEGNIYLQPLFDLDKCAGGVTVFCLTSKAFERSRESLQNGECDFRFYAVTVGETVDTNGGLSLTVERLKDTKMRKAPMLVDKAIKIDFNYRKLATLQKISLYQITMTEFVRDSIRFGMSSLKVPVFGDADYEGDTLAKGTYVALYLVDFGFTHPTTNAKMTFRCLPPEKNKPWVYFDLGKLLTVLN